MPPICGKGRFLRTFPIIGFDLQCNSIFRLIKARKVNVNGVSPLTYDICNCFYPALFKASNDLSPFLYAMPQSDWLDSVDMEVK